MGENHMGGEGGREVRELHPDPIWIEKEGSWKRGAFCGGAGSGHTMVKIARRTLVLQGKKDQRKA